MKHFFAVLAVLLASVLLFSCGKSPEASPVGESAVPAAKAVKIGVLAPTVTHGWVAAVAFFAEERCKELGNNVQYKICTSSSAEEMTTQLDELQAWGADAIVAFPQWTGMDVPMKQAMRAGTKIVMFDISIEAEEAYLVTGDNESMGIGSAEYIVSKVGPNATVVALEVPTSGTVSGLRVKGFMDTVAKIAPKMNILRYATKFTREDGLKDFTDILAANPKIDAVFSIDDETSIGVLQAIKEAGRTDIKVVTGGGGCQEYFKLMPQYQEIYVQSALYAPSMVKQAVDVAYDLGCGKFPSKKIVIPTTIVDRENVKEFLNENSPY